jgi:hypothetical protein
MAMMKGLMRVARAAACVVLTLCAGATTAAAQTDEEFDKIFPFIGSWDSQIESPNGQDRGNCGGRTGDYGEKLLNCSLPADQLPLNARGEAWLKYMDHRQSPTLAECAEISNPTMFGNGIYISASPGRVEMAHPQAAERTIWMNGGGPRPRPGELFQHGLSVGRFEGNDLVVVTTNFTFDPDGMDDHLHMASSVRKKVTERYHMVEDDVMRLIITLEDPTFLTRPFKYAFLYARQRGGPAPGWRSCDPDLGRREVEFAYPGNKYPDAKEAK